MRLKAMDIWDSLSLAMDTVLLASYIANGEQILVLPHNMRVSKHEVELAKFSSSLWIILSFDKFLQFEFLSMLANDIEIA